jgi:hypothetical protein
MLQTASDKELTIYSDVNPEMHQLNIDADNRIQVSHFCTNDEVGCIADMSKGA